MNVIDRVRALVEPALVPAGVEVVDVAFAGHTLKVLVDRPGGVDLEVVANATRVVSDLLDQHDPVPGQYTLEVSSPGVERPLRTPEHFRRFVGSRVAVRTVPGVAGDRRIEDVLVAADDEGIVVGERALAYTDIERARTVFTWGQAPKPVGPKGKKKAPTP